MARKPAPEGAVRLKVTLKGMKPPVWRRLLVEDTTTLGELHAAIQAAMGWGDGHLHLFLLGHEEIGDPRQLDGVGSEARVTVGELAILGWKSFDYVYDMGDDWKHAIRIEGVEPLEPARAYPACIAGKRACPPEDSGGPWGIAAKLEAVADPSHPDHEEIKEWLGDFDPEDFSVEAAEARVRRWFAPKQGRRGR